MVSGYADDEDCCNKVVETSLNVLGTENLYPVVDLGDIAFRFKQTERCYINYKEC
jgi:hypothetical protein